MKVRKAQHFKIPESLINELHFHDQESELKRQARFRVDLWRYIKFFYAARAGAVACFMSEINFANYSKAHN